MTKVYTRLCHKLFVGPEMLMIDLTSMVWNSSQTGNSKQTNIENYLEFVLIEIVKCHKF